MFIFGEQEFLQFIQSFGEFRNLGQCFFFLAFEIAGFVWILFWQVYFAFGLTL